MLPIRDHNPTIRQPIVTWGLIVANLAIWVLIQAMPNRASADRYCEEGVDRDCIR